MSAVKSRVQKKVWFEAELKGLSSAQRQKLAEMSVERIRQRSANGIDSRGRNFSYAPDSEYDGNNLTLTGDMMTMLDVVSTSSGIVLGYTDMEAQETLQAENHQNAVTYSPQWKKPFIGLTQDDKDLLKARLETEAPSNPIIDSIFNTESQDDFAKRFIANLFRNQGQ